MISLRRRILLRALVAMAVSLIPRSWPAGASAPNSGSRDLAATEAPDSVALPAFLELSRLVTGKPDLPEAVGQRLLSLYHSDPDRLEGLSELYRRIVRRRRGAAPFVNAEFWTRTARLDEGLKHAARQLLEEWYTGVYRDGRQVFVFAYDDALMYRPCRGVHPVPARCGGEIGFWSKPPGGFPERPMMLPERD
jgi:hypothetical protein